jgi:hypothetical protein
MQRYENKQNEAGLKCTFGTPHSKDKFYKISQKYERALSVRYEVLMAVKMPTLVFWVVTLRELVGRYQHFRVT